MCNYQFPFFRCLRCPFPSESGKNFCIFHLSEKEKDPDEFWKHLASYIRALLDKAGTEETRRWAEKNSGHWIFNEADEFDSRYAGQIVKYTPWTFTGFIFPSMDDEHNFSDFVFPAVDFSDARFSGKADFREAQFSRYADFTRAQFGWDAAFSDAQFSGEADFSKAEFDAPVYFIQTTVTGLLEFYRAKLRNRMLFAGTVIEENAKVLLWDIDFVHGTSEISFEKGYQKGKIVEPAGQIVFRDISKGMNRISFLHTDIFTDRLLVRFLNVNWKKSPKEFIFDAKFAFIKESEWDVDTLKTKTGLREDLIKLIPEFFFTREQSQEGSVQESIDRELKRCQLLVKQDVERIAREIRRSTEEYGSYSDAGDFYIAEMDYRRSKTEKKPFRPLLFWLALSLYKLVSDYGESPSRALL